MFKLWYQYPSAGVFLDFGSGCGKLCLAAALLHPFQKAGHKAAKISSVMVQLCGSHGMDFLETNNCGDSIDFFLNGFELTRYIQNRSIPTQSLLNVVTLRSSASKPCRASMTLKHKFRQSTLRLTSISWFHRELNEHSEHWTHYDRSGRTPWRDGETRDELCKRRGKWTKTSRIFESKFCIPSIYWIWEWLWVLEVTLCQNLMESWSPSHLRQVGFATSHPATAVLRMQTDSYIFILYVFMHVQTGLGPQHL